MTKTAGSAARRPSRRRVVGRGLAALAAVFLLAALVYFGLLVLGHNRGVIVPGEVYRSAQLDETDLRHEIEQFHMKSVINLRGQNGQSAWYVRELAVCQAEGVEHDDVRMSARHLPPPEEVERLMGLFATLPEPILVHCNGGSDRTGLAGAIYLIVRKGVAPRAATRTLSVRYAHFPIYPYFAMDEFFRLFERENPHQRSLADWVRQDYPALYAREERKTTWDKMLEPFE